MQKHFSKYKILIKDGEERKITNIVILIIPLYQSITTVAILVYISSITYITHANMFRPPRDADNCGVCMYVYIPVHTHIYPHQTGMTLSITIL